MKALVFLLALASVVSSAVAADLQVNWKNSATYVDGSAMPATDIASSTVSCGLTTSTLTLTVAVQGAVETATVSGALAGKSYVCGVQTNSKTNGSSTMAFSSAVTVPAPKPSPPSGVTTTVLASNTTAYKMRQAADGYSFVAIGTIPAGTACDANHTVDGFTLVPRAAVSLASRFDTMPLVVFAKCG